MPNQKDRIGRQTIKNMFTIYILFMKTGIVTLPMHWGKAPRWLFDRMVKLSRVIIHALVDEFNTRGCLNRISNPYWFQCLSCVLGYDWHSSGTTTVTCGAIKEALKDGRFTTFFQPIIDNKTEAIVKYESLVRMIDTDGKVISPFFFLDIAKKAKLYSKITKIVVDKTFFAFEKLPQYEFSLNITVEDIYNKEISAYIFKKLSDFPHPDKVIFEITESEEISDYESVNVFITKIKSLGAKISIDDFGSGYANFEHILSLNADFI